MRVALCAACRGTASKPETVTELRPEDQEVSVEAFIVAHIRQRLTTRDKHHVVPSIKGDGTPKAPHLLAENSARFEALIVVLFWIAQLLLLAALGRGRAAQHAKHSRTCRASRVIASEETFRQQTESDK